MSTAPTPVAHASVSKINSLEKSGRASTGALINADLSDRKEALARGDQMNYLFFFNRSLSGLEIMPKWRINFL